MAWRVTPLYSAKLFGLTVVGFSGLEKCRETVVFRPRFVDPSVGVTETTAGGVVSLVPAVVKLSVEDGTVFPVKSCTPLTETTIGEPDGNTADGVNVTSGVERGI